METFEDVNTNGNLYAPVVFGVHIKAFVGSRDEKIENVQKKRLKYFIWKFKRDVLTFDKKRDVLTCIQKIYEYNKSTSFSLRTPHVHASII